MFPHQTLRSAVEWIFVGKDATLISRIICKLVKSELVTMSTGNYRGMMIVNLRFLHRFPSYKNCLDYRAFVYLTLLISLLQFKHIHPISSVYEMTHGRTIGREDRCSIHPLYTPIDGTLNTPIDGTLFTPIDGTLFTPINGTLFTPIDGTLFTPTDGHCYEAYVNPLSCG